MSLSQVLNQAAILGDTKGARRSIRLHLIIGLAAVAVLVIGLGGWASTQAISGALIAPGQIVVESNVKKVQHPTGGVIGELRAKDGDTVKAGDIVVRLDDTVTKANLAIVTKNLDAAMARAARLEAEQRGTDTIKFPPQLTSRASDPDVASVMASESKLFDVRVNGRAGQKSARDEYRRHGSLHLLSPLWDRKRRASRSVAAVASEPGDYR